MRIRTHWTIWLATPQRPVPLAASTVALRSTVPQKSAVNRPALKLKMAKAMNTRMDAIFTTITTALRNAALSTPRMTRNVMAHKTSETMMTPPTAGLPVTGSEKTPGRRPPRQ